MLGDGHCFRDQVINLCEMRNFQHRNLPFDFEGDGAVLALDYFNKNHITFDWISDEGGAVIVQQIAPRI